MANVDIHKLQLLLETKGVTMTKAELKALGRETTKATGGFMKMWSNRRFSKP